MKKAKTFYSHDRKWCYQISVIDYLQTFDRGKKNEVLAKKYFKNADPMGLSARPSEPYGTRFMHFMKKSVFANKYKDEEKDGLIKELELHIKELLR